MDNNDPKDVTKLDIAKIKKKRKKIIESDKIVKK